MGRVWTEAQKREKSEAVRRYWQEHGHPNQGKKHSYNTRMKMGKPKQRSAIGGHCTLCGRALYAPDSVKRGLGSQCAGLC